jgi:ribosomal protein S18 acetylase RimI-like enzyme
LKTHDPTHRQENVTKERIMSMLFFRITFAVWAVSLITQQPVQALVILAPVMGQPFFSAAASREQENGKIIKLRLRSTKESDINGVTDILAAALVDPHGEQERGRFNFKLKMELLKMKSGVEPLLLSRLRAIHAGQTLIDSCPLELSETDKLRMMWSNDPFRSKMEKAARLSKEPHIWSRHNFACAPESACCLQHKMITAENALSGEIVGFCEVAMLWQPMEGDECSLEEAGAPTIVNLATSPRYRRLGIGSRLTKAASKFAQRRWLSDEMTLYVDKENEAAVSMYKNLGFEKRAEVESESRSQWYMTQPLDTSAKIVPTY